MRDPGSPGNTTPQRGPTPAPMAKPTVKPYVAPKKASTPVKKATPAKSGGSSVAATPKINNDELAQQYGFTMGLLNAYPELKTLFNNAVSGGWTADKFQAKLRDTNWYKAMPDTERKYILLQATDPATYGQNWGTATLHIQGLATQMGYNPYDWPMIQALAYNIQAKGWGDDQVRQWIGQHLVFGSNNSVGGLAGQTVQNLQTYSYQMGAQNADWWYQDRTRRIVSGMLSEQDAKNEIMQQGIAMFPQYEKQIRAGSTVQDLAQPYMQSMQQILELNAGSINLFDPTIKKAMAYKDPTGAQAAKPLWEFQNDLRTDDRWKKTQNAQDAAMSTAHKVLSDFGKVT